MVIRQLGVMIFGASAGAVGAQQPPPDYGHNFVTIGNVGNAAYQSANQTSLYDGRGSVNYTYRIASLEINSGQFVEFGNALNNARIDGIIASGARGGFGAGIDPSTGNLQFKLFSDESATWPVRELTWRTAAIYCNWLHNGKGSEPSNFMSGAYDISTFGIGDDGRFTDQPTRSPGAKYWIPNADEWLKAVHYDPDKNAPGDGGWWTYPNGSDAPPVPGLPGEGETSARLTSSVGGTAWEIPVGAYPDHTTPYGLLDASGAASEWLEDFLDVRGGGRVRIFDAESTYDRRFPDFPEFDFDNVAFESGSIRPDSTQRGIGLRVASAIPSPSSAVLVGIALIAGGARRRRSGTHAPVQEYRPDHNDIACGVGGRTDHR